MNYIAMNVKAHIHFADGTKLRQVQSVVYSAGTLNENAEMTEELQARMTKTLHTCRKLKVFWRKSNAHASGSYTCITQL